MIYYIYLRTRPVWLYMLLIVCGTHALYKFFEPVRYLSLFAIAGSLFMGIQSNWILNVPYSRKKILLWNAFESLGLIISAVFFGAFIVFPMGLIKLSEISEMSEKFWVWVVILTVLFFVRFCSVMRSPQMMYSQTVKKGLVRLLLIFGIGTPALYYFGKQPLFWILGIASLAVILPVGTYSLLNPPRDSLHRTKKMGAILYAIFVVATCSYGVINVLFLPISSKTAIVVDLLGDISVPLGRARGIELLNHPKIGDATFSQKLESRYGSEIKFEDLKYKAENCRNRDCSLLVKKISDRFDQDQRLEVFAAFLKSCALIVSDPDGVVCSYKIFRVSTNDWFSLLAKSNKIDDWLKSEDQNKRFAAIRVLGSVGANKDQLRIIEKINHDYRDFSAAEAKELIEKYQPQILMNKEKCKIDPNDVNACGREARFFLNSKRTDTIL